MARNSEGDRFKTFSRRTALLAGGQGLMAVTLAGRLYYLSVVEGDQYKMLAEDNRVSLRLLAPNRGRIFDRFGESIATNRQDYRVFLIPEQAKDVRETLLRLGRIIELDEGDRRRIERQIARQREFMPVTVAEALDWRSFARINVESPELPGIQPNSGMTRWYPNGPLAAQVIGYVGTPSEAELDGDPLLSLPGFKVGKRGIEKVFDSVLRGRAGSTRVEVNAYGRIIRELGRVEGEPGHDVTLTLDMELQRYAAERLGEEAAGVVVMDVETGDIYVHASTPSYDPNDFNFGISRENWQALLKDPRKPLVNKCLTGQYPPGSTFKMVVALAALHHGIIDPDRIVYCSGRYPYGDNVWHCWKKWGHGEMGLVDAIAQSCDTYFYEVAQELGIEKIAAWAEKFGLGEVFDLEVGGESKGLVPDPDWKLATTGEPWLGGETLNVGIGQGALLATPLQLAVMTARLANGGKAVMPHLVHSAAGEPVERPAQFADLGLRGWELSWIHRGMEAVMELEGTAYASRIDVDGKRMAGKTGTAQVRRITKEQRDREIKQESLPWKDRHHAWFVAYAPTDKPRYAMCVLIEHGGGGSSAAAPVAADIMAEVLRRDPASKPMPSLQVVQAETDAETGGAGGAP